MIAQWPPFAVPGECTRLNGGHEAIGGGGQSGFGGDEYQ